MKQFLLCSLLLWSFGNLHSQEIIPQNEIAKARNLMNANNISSSDLNNALKLTLVLSLNDAISNLGKKNGFYKDQLVHIDLPPDVQSSINGILSNAKNQIDQELEKQLNRVAEQAMSKAKPIFKAELDRLKFLNSLNTLLAKEDEATQNFKDQASPELVEKLKPIIQRLLDSTGANQKWNDLVANLQKTGILVNTNLTDYVTQKAVDGVFTKMGQQETKVKSGNILLTSALLKSVYDIRSKVIR